MSNTTENSKSKKAKGIIRWEAIIPFTLIIGGIGLYSHFFLDHHLRKGMEWAGYEALGSEVNISEIKSSFFNASIEITGLQLTNSEKPSHNSIEIGSIRFGMSWDALLRAKVLINEMAVEGIKYDTTRKTIGRVKPPTPPAKGPGMAEQLSQEALGMIEDQHQNNVMGDIAAILGGGDSSAQLDKLQAQLASKEMIGKFEADLKAKQLNWDQRIKSLPTNKDIEALNQRLQKVKTKDFKTPQELQTALSELDSIIKDGDAKYKQISSAAGDLNSDLAKLNAELKSLEEQIKADIKELQAHFKIPNLDVAALGKSLFMAQLNPYLSKVAYYRGLAYKYLPPKYTNPKSKDSEQDENLQPHPRASGITYEFGRQNSYPLLWIKRTAISSEAGQGGVVKGEILDITTHQKLTGKPTTLKINADFPDNELRGLNMIMSMDNRPKLSIIRSEFKIAQYKYQAKTLSDSSDLKLIMNPKFGSVDLKAELIGLKDLKLNLVNKFNDVQFEVDSKNAIAKEVLQNIFSAIKDADITASVQGSIPKVDISISSNVGPAVAKGLEAQINKKIDEAKQKIQAYIDTEVGNKKKELESQITKLKNQLEGEISKAKSQLDTQKKQVEDKIKAAKSDGENKAKSNLEKEAKKAAEELKKKLGF